ncbi:MAG: hypothetical protein R3C56_07085 [Pirellulaceae bacterium]
MNAWLGRIGLVVAMGGLFWLLSPPLAALRGQTAYSQQESAARPLQNSLQVQSTMLSSGVQQLSVIDSQSKSLAVYHIEPTTGKILLKSVRNLQWDLQMEHFNGQAPLPGELRQVNRKQLVGWVRPPS